MNFQDYLCNSWVVMLISGMTDNRIRVEYGEEENPHYQEIYNEEKETRINKLWQQEFQQCIKDQMEERGLDEETLEIQEFCSNITNDEYEELAQEVDDELKNLTDIKKTFIEYYEIRMFGLDSDVMLVMYYHNVDYYGHVDKYIITGLMMNCNMHEDTSYDHFSYENPYWSLQYHGPVVAIFL